MDDKEQLRKELNLILTASEKYDLTNLNSLKKLLAFYESKGSLKTTLGKKYIERLKDISNGGADDKCFICKSNTAADGIICTSCMAKYSNGQKQIYSNKEKVTDTAPRTEEAKETDKDIGQETTTSKTKNKRLIFVIVLAILSICIMLMIGLGRVFTFLALASLVYLIYVCVTKKKKRNAIIAFVILLLLAGVTNAVGTSSNPADFANSKVDVETFLSAFESTMNEQIKESSGSEYRGYCVLASEGDNNATYEVVVINKTAGVIQLAYDEKKNVETVIVYSSSSGTEDYKQMGLFLSSALVRTLNPDMDFDEAAELINIISKKDMEIHGNYGYTFINYDNEVWLMATSKKKALEVEKEMKRN